jgi:hypothetical protein
MSGWQILIVCVTCAWGAAIFLGVVALEVQACERALESLEDEEQNACRKRPDSERRPEVVAVRKSA